MTWSKETENRDMILLIRQHLREMTEPMDRHFFLSECWEGYCFECGGTDQVVGNQCYVCGCAEGEEREWAEQQDRESDAQR